MDTGSRNIVDEMFSALTIGTCLRMSGKNPRGVRGASTTTEPGDSVR